jgi:hypothetical protein
MTVVFSHANLAISETNYTTDASLNTVQYLDVLAQAGSGPNTMLWSIGTSQIGASGWTTHGQISIPTELLGQDTAYNIDSGTYQSALGANIFLTGATGLVGYDMSAMSAATKTLIDNLSADQWITGQLRLRDPDGKWHRRLEHGHRRDWRRRRTDRGDRRLGAGRRPA